MKKYKGLIILLNLIILLVYFNFAIVKKESLLTDGQLIFLELAPVDPRSLMQGDYMSLRYKIAEHREPENIDKTGYCVVQLDSNKVANKIRFQKNKTPLANAEHLIKFASSDSWNIHFGAESYFFQEGQAQKYENAKFGGLRIDKEGNSLLVKLFDAHLRPIE